MRYSSFLVALLTACASSSPKPPAATAAAEVVSPTSAFVEAEVPTPGTRVSLAVQQDSLGLQAPQQLAAAQGITELLYYLSFAGDFEVKEMLDNDPDAGVKLSGPGREWLKKGLARLGPSDSGALGDIESCFSDLQNGQSGRAALTRLKGVLSKLPGSMQVVSHGWMGPVQKGEAGKSTLLPAESYRVFELRGEVDRATRRDLAQVLSRFESTLSGSKNRSEPESQPLSRVRTPTERQPVPPVFVVLDACSEDNPSLSEPWATYLEVSAIRKSCRTGDAPRVFFAVLSANQGRKPKQCGAHLFGAEQTPAGAGCTTSAVSENAELLVWRCPSECPQGSSLPPCNGQFR